MSRRFALASRRAYALPLVMLLLLTATLSISVALQRQAAQQRLISRMVGEYRRHHDMFGVQSIVLLWLGPKSASELTAMAADPAVDYDFAIPSGSRVQVFVEDGQGAALRDLGAVPEAQRGFYAGVLSRLPLDNPEASRGGGPHPISVNAAPWNVLAALVPEDGDRLADRIVRARESGPIDRAEFSRELRFVGVSDEVLRSLIQIVVFDPELWRLRIVAHDADGERVFVMLVENVRNRVTPTIHEWVEYFSSDGNEAGPGESEAPPPERRGTRAGRQGADDGAPRSR